MSTNLPNPGGEYVVGCVDILPKRGPEAVLFRLYYPTPERASSKAQLPLWVDEKEYTKGYTKLVQNALYRKMLERIVKKQRVPVHWEAPSVAGHDRKFPVIVFSHGLAGNRTSNSYTCYEMASYGFIVASVEHKDLTASATYFVDDQTGEKKWIYLLRKFQWGHPSDPFLRSMQAMKRTHECSECLNYLHQLENGTLSNLLSDLDLRIFIRRLKLNQVAIMGHSLGATTAYGSILQDHRFAVGVFMDARSYEISTRIISAFQRTCSRPVLFLHSEEFHLDTKVCINRMELADMSLMKELRFIGVEHSTFCDFALILPQFIARSVGFVGKTNPLLANQAAIEAALKFIGEKFDLPFQDDVDSLVSKYKFVVTEATFRRGLHPK